MASRRISLVWITVTDLEKAIQYYTDVIGLKLSTRSDEFGWAELIGEGGGAILGIAQMNDHDKMPAGQNAVVAITVPNLESVKSELTAKGAILVGDTMEVPGHVKLQMFKDVDGNTFQLAQELS